SATASTSYTFTAHGGSGGYVFSIVSGQSSINASTGVFTAPATAGTTVVRVKDSNNSAVTATVTTSAAVVLSDFDGAHGLGGRVNGIAASPASGQGGTAFAVGYTQTC